MITKSVNIYDFDHTIYDGDASLDFILYCILRKPRLWGYAPRLLQALARYILGVWSRAKVKQEFFAFLPELQDVDKVVTDFWDSHQHRLAGWYKDQQRPTDIIISASPEFLLMPIAQKLGVDELIATKIDPLTGKLSGRNCRGAEKVRRLYEYKAEVKISECYSDSLSDLPLLKLADYPVIVRNHKLIPLDQHKPPRLQAFSDPAFLRFLLVGGVNATCGVLFSYVISLLIPSRLLAFVVGYLLSLIVSYFLNGFITFKQTSFSVRQFASFCISYIPNFVINLIIVHVLADLVGLYPLVAYALAAMIAAPITFLMLSKFTFTKALPS